VSQVRLQTGLKTDSTVAQKQKLAWCDAQLCWKTHFNKKMPRRTALQNRRRLRPSHANATPLCVCDTTDLRCTIYDADIMTIQLSLTHNVEMQVN